jgi:cytochrome c oxidase assembly factor CtaG
MTTPPLITAEAQQKKDTEHLRLLSVFHFVMAGIAFLGIVFIVLHFLLVSTFMRPEFWKAHNAANPPPKEIMTILLVFYVVVGFFFVLGATLNLLSGLFLRKRRNKVFSMIVAGLNCLHVPLGTALGVFTFIVLSRDSVGRLYEQNRAGLT